MDQNQFECVNSRSTTLALLKLTDEWFKAFGKTNNIIRILFVDFTKAFDIIDHNNLLKKFSGWIMDVAVSWVWLDQGCGWIMDLAG